MCMCFFPCVFCLSTSQSPLDNENSRHNIGKVFFFFLFLPPVFFKYLNLFLPFVKKKSVLQILNVLATSSSLIFSYDFYVLRFTIQYEDIS